MAWGAHRAFMRACHVLLVVGLAGCQAGEPPAAARIALSANWSEGQARGSVEPMPGWWRGFGSRELDGLVERGLADSATLEAAVARIGQAAALARTAAASLVPAIGLTDTVDRTVGVSEKISQALLLAASYEVDFWGRNRAVANSAATLVVASALDAETACLLLAAGIANAYFQVLSLRERVRQAQAAARDAGRVLVLVRAQREAGTASDLQVEQQLSALRTFEATVPVLAQQRDLALHLLAVLVGVQAGTLKLHGAGLAGVRRPVPRAGQPGLLLTRRPDVRAAEERLAAARFDVEAARVAFLPRLVVGGGFGHAAMTTAGLLPSVLLTNLAAGLVQPIFDGGRLQGQLELTEERRAELLALYRQTVLTSLQDVEDSLTSLRELRRQEEASRGAAEAARRARAIAEQQYRIGSADYLTVLNTQRTLYGAEDALLQVGFAQRVALVALFRALGGGFDGLPPPVPLAPRPIMSPTPRSMLSNDRTVAR